MSGITQVPAAMKAVRVHEPGETERLRYEDAPVPEPGVGDVLVRVHAASFTPTELSWPSSWVDRLGHDRRPIIPGHELSGTVQALGYGTTGVAVGDEVFGVSDWYRDGALAEFVAVEARNLAPMPPRPRGSHIGPDHSYPRRRRRGRSACCPTRTRGGGVLVSAVQDPAATANQRPGRRGVFFVVEPNRQQLIELSGGIGAGELRPVVGGIYPLADAAAAFEAKQRGGIPGKIAVRVVDHPPATA